MKKNALKYIGLLIFLASASVEVMGKSYQNPITARSFYKSSCNSLYQKALVRTFFPIPILSTIIQSPPKWKKYKACKTMYRYFKSAYVLIEKKDATPKQIKKAQTRLTSFLNDLQSETKSKEEVINPFINNQKAQQTLNKKIYSWTVTDLAKLLNIADRVFPESLGDPNVGLVRYDKTNFMFSLRTVDSFDENKSIFDVDIERKKALLKESGFLFE